MTTRDTLRYVLAGGVGVIAWLTNESPWTYIGIVVIVLAVLGYLWHRQVAESD